MSLSGEYPMPLTASECVAPTMPPPPSAECVMCEAVWDGDPDDECHACGMQSSRNLKAAKETLT